MAAPQSSIITRVAYGVQLPRVDLGHGLALRRLAEVALWASLLGPYVLKPLMC